MNSMLFDNYCWTAIRCFSCFDKALLLPFGLSSESHFMVVLPSVELDGFEGGNKLAPPWRFPIFVGRARAA